MNHLNYWRLYARIFNIKICRQCGERLDKDFRKRKQGYLCRNCYKAEHRSIALKQYYAKMDAEGSFTNKEWDNKLKEYNFSCAYCKKELSLETITIDHKIPISRGGSSKIENVVPSCRSCNSKKGQKEYSEFVNLKKS